MMNGSIEIIASKDEDRVLGSTGAAYSNHAMAALWFIENETAKAYKDYSEYSLLKLNYKFDRALKKSDYKPSKIQKKAFDVILYHIANVKGYNVDELQIKVSADDELLIIREGKRGLHYIIVGKEDMELFYGFSGKEVGNYLVVQFDGKAVIVNNIVSRFLNI